MNIFRRFSIGLVSFLLFLSLLMIPAVVSLQVVFSSPEAVKSSLSKSGVYDSLVETDLLSESEVLPQAVLSDPGITAALKGVVSPSYVRTSVEKIIDNAYSYVRGDAASANLSVDVSSVKATFAENVAAYVKQKFETLPRCTAFAVPSVSIEALLQASCVPLGVSSQQAGEYARSEIMDTALFSNDQLDVATLAGIKQSTLEASLADMRQAYPYVVASLYILPILSVVFAIALVFLSTTKRRGIKRIASLLLVAGLINVVVVLVGLAFLSVVGLDGLSSGTVLSSAIQDMITHVRTWWLGMSGGFVVVALVIYLILGFTRRSQSMTLRS